MCNLSATQYNVGYALMKGKEFDKGSSCKFKGKDWVQSGKKWSIFTGNWSTEEPEKAW